MSININQQITHNRVAVEQNKSQKKQGVNKENETVTNNSNDSVKLTSQALNLSKSQKTSAPQINEQRIASIKAAILNGDYKINTDRLAEKLSKFEGDFSKAFS